MKEYFQKKEVDFSEEGIQLCVQYGKLAYFDLLVFNKSEGLACMEKINEEKKYFMHAFTIMAAKM